MSRDKDKGKDKDSEAQLDAGGKAKVKKVRRNWIRSLIGVVVTYSIFAVVLAAIAFILGWGSISRTLPDLHGWHEEGPASEFRAKEVDASYTLDDYLEQEARVFDELAALIKGSWKDDQEGPYSRFHVGSVCDPATILDRNWNRTFVLEHEKAVGGALLLHGLSDSPYSLRAMGLRLHEEGWTVVGLRIPGHGTCPKALAEVSHKDWTAAVRVAALGVRERIPEGSPMILMGFSNGGALSVQYALSAIEDPDLPRPDGLILFSPMIGITSLAQITRLHRIVELIPGFEKAAWQGIDAAIDPFKYSSWPMNASEQAWFLTTRVEGMLARLDREGLMGEMAPVLAFQSVVDSTVLVPRLISNLFYRLGEGSELVLFDVNRVGMLDELLKFGFEDEIVPLLKREDLGFGLTLITNEHAGSSNMVVRTREGTSFQDTPLGMSWPDHVYSLSHLAPPIPPDDPILGTAEATKASGLALGTLNLRGETGVLRISNSLMLRMRNNPFYEYVEKHAMEWLGEEVMVGKGE